jgi:glyoxylase-like metal-dependent hydrolase (beta-lactamase superfamily II)
MKIIENVYLVPGVVANPYVIVDEDGLTLIDTGLPHNEKKILSFIVGLGRSGPELKRIIITHSDLDHIGSLAALQKLTGARTYASRIEAESIAKGHPSRQIKSSGFSLMRLAFSLLRPFMKVKPFQVDEIVSDGQVLPALGGLNVVETSGHSPGHISLFAPTVGVLFSGDSLVTDENVIHGSRPGLTWDEAKAREAESRQMAIGARIVCSGHGPVIKEAQSKFQI